MMMKKNEAAAKERKFYNALRDIFVGAKVEGKSGYINLMRVKSRYYENGVLPRLKKDIEDALKPFPGFREELFDKLYTFFNRYFSETGSIYFNYTPPHQSVYEKVYADDRDVMLFYKTHMLYYVKTDRLFRSMDIEVDGHKFFFDVSALEHKKATEKREIVYEFKTKRKDGTLVFGVTYSAKGKKTGIGDILRELKKQSIRIGSENLERAFGVFERQSEVDYFINKNARVFLEEQFDLWLYQYVFSGESEWTEERIRQLQALKEIAFKIIAFISQFEDELVKIWNKPKFVLNSNYIITLDRIAGRDMGLARRLLRHKNFELQVNEWRQLGIVGGSFSKSNVVKGSKGLNAKYRYLPIDTKYFKDLELEILGLFENLDEAIDGWLIKSENYQALNTLLPKFQEKVKCIYIDPPYNVGSSEISYVNKFKHSSWLTMMANRMVLAKNILSDDGVLCVTIDHTELHRLRSLLEELFSDDNILGLVCIKSNPSGRSTVKGFSMATEYAIFVGASEKASIGTVPRTEQQISQYNEEDEIGKFQWRNFMRAGGANDYREARPRLHYPLFVSAHGVRIPKMNWIKERKCWLLTERASVQEHTIYPKSADGTEYTWRLGVETLNERLNDLRVRNSRKGQPIIEVKFRADEEGVLPKTIWDNKLFNATAYGTSLLGDIMGSTKLFSFPKSVYAVEESIRVCKTSSHDLVLDFFAGSGTTGHAVINLNRQDGDRRKYLLVEMADYFETVMLPRIKKVVFCEKWKDGKPAGGEGISHMVKYYELEQYEDVLRRAEYGDSELFDDPNRDPYHQYVFLRDLKMLKALEVDLKRNRVKVDLSKLYDGIDIAETLSTLKGKWIKKVGPDFVEFKDGEKVGFKDLDYRLIKPLIWW
jgi:adenine-specific DNA-methyltransferase